MIQIFLALPLFCSLYAPPEQKSWSSPGFNKQFLVWYIFIIKCLKKELHCLTVRMKEKNQVCRHCLWIPILSFSNSVNLGQLCGTSNQMYPMCLVNFFVFWQEVLWRRTMIKFYIFEMKCFVLCIVRSESTLIFCVLQYWWNI